MLNLGCSNAKGKGTECAMCGCVTVSTNDGHAWLGEALFRANNMNDALANVLHIKKLNAKGVSFTEINVMATPKRKAELVQRANGGYTVPQIFIGDTHVGGSDDLHALEQAGKLDALLAA